MFSATAGLADLSGRLGSARADAEAIFRPGRRSGILVDLKKDLAALKEERERVDTVRWAVQFEIQEVAGFRGSKGLTDRAVANGYRHRFTVGSTFAARRLAIMMAPLIASGKVVLWIDGTIARPQPALAA
ncbi:hypothetical protein [Bradyrhizobium sp. USDA 223]|uniref:hypothetical protein n=1 Tax=Bradyrhizobium sp. USDA 223 TaxID=3156306 RepID=UPI003833BE41